MLQIFLFFVSAILITVVTKKLGKWLIEKHTLQRAGYFIIISVIALLLCLKWIIYQNHYMVYLTNVLMGIIVGIIFGMVPKTNKVLLINKHKKRLVHIIIIYFTLIIYAFASLYFCIEITNTGSFVGYTHWNNFGEAIIEFLYFSITTFSTVGFGDIVPVSSIAKIAVCTEILVTFRTITLGALFISPDSIITDTSEK